MKVLRLKSKDHPEANGHQPKHGDVCWRLSLVLEDGTKLELEVGQKTRDVLFGMMIADCQDSGEKEPV